MLHKKTVLLKKLLFYKLTGCKNTAFFTSYLVVFETPPVRSFIARVV